MTSEIVGVFADGGVVHVNPSPYGLTWAFCFTDRADCRIREASGLVRAAELPGGVATNNQAEWLAILHALEALPDGWSGPVHSDSQVSLGRFFNGWRLGENFPPEWIARGSRARTRLGFLRPVLLSGHPTHKQLALGIGKRGTPCSPHNVWCDLACKERARAYRMPVEGVTV